MLKVYGISRGIFLNSAVLGSLGLGFRVYDPDASFPLKCPSCQQNITEF